MAKPCPNPQTVGPERLAKVIRQIRRLEEAVPGTQAGAGPRLVPLGWPALGKASQQGSPVQASAGGGLATSVVHEWFGILPAGGDPVKAVTKLGHWRPPLCLLSHLAWCGFEHGVGGRGRVFWIGHRCWPNPSVLLRDRGRNQRLIHRSIFVDPPDGPTCLWAAELAARCPAVSVVVADGSGWEMAGSRRLQLAARAGPALVLLTRPPQELKALSVAATRWLVRSVPSRSWRQRWSVELLRCKGLQPAPAQRRWALEWNGAEGGVVVPAELVGGPVSQTRPQRPSIFRGARQSA